MTDWRLTVFQDTSNSVPVPSLTGPLKRKLRFLPLVLILLNDDLLVIGRCTAAPATPIGWIKLFMGLKTSVGSPRLTASGAGPRIYFLRVTSLERMIGTPITKGARKNCKIFNKRDCNYSRFLYFCNKFLSEK